MHQAVLEAACDEGALELGQQVAGAAATGGRVDEDEVAIVGAHARGLRPTQ